MRFLTPLCALVALAALLPLAAALLGRSRVGAVGRGLGLLPPAARTGLLRPIAASVAIVLLGLAAAQPVLVRHSGREARKDVQALFVLDTSRSMAASSTPTSPSRLDRAVAAAERLRAAISDVPAGVATLTDRVLPSLLPVADPSSFDGVVSRAVAIESPPPRDSGVRATSYAALADVASGNYFAPSASRRLVVLLTDGESNPLDAGAIARALPARQGYRLLAVRFWRSDESVYGPDGRPEAGYRPDPSGGALLAGLATATGGRSFAEGDLAAASSALRGLAGRGPAVPVAGVGGHAVALAPYLALAALALLLVALVPRPRQLGLPSVRLTRQ